MLFVGIKPRCTSNPNFVRNSCCGGKLVILISSRNILHSFLLEGAGPVRWPNTLPPCAILPAHAAYARVDLWKVPFWKETPVTLWHCKSLFPGKDKDQLVVKPASVSHLSFLLFCSLPHFGLPCVFTAPAQGLPWNLLWAAVHTSFIHALLYIRVFCELPLARNTCSRMGPWISHVQALKPRVFLLNPVSPGWEKFSGAEPECRSAIQQCVGV